MKVLKIVFDTAVHMLAYCSTHLEELVILILVKIII